MTWAWLQRYVADVRIATFAGDRPIMRLPDGRTALYVRVLADGNTGDVTLAGPRTRALHKTASGVSRMIVIELKPGWSAQLFGLPARALTDRYVHLHDAWGATGARLRDDLLALRDPADILERIGAALAERTAHLDDPSTARLARRAVHLLETEPLLAIAAVADRLGVTPRHLRRAFVDHVGVGPKDYARTVRLHRAMDRSTNTADWGQIAAATGYYDQAHLHLDFRELVGLTPRAFAAARAGDGLAQRPATPRA